MVTQARTTVWIAVLVAAGCGRHGFDSTGDAQGIPDYTPDPVDWADFDGVSAARELSGINQSVDVNVMVANATGTPTIEFRTVSYTHLTLPTNREV